MKKPFYYATLAAGYIVLIVNFMNYFFWMPNKPNTPDVPNIAIPIMFLSLFTLSAAVMAFLFFWRPTHLFLAGEHHKALKFFGATLGYFAGYAVLFVVTVLYSLH